MAQLSGHGVVLLALEQTRLTPNSQLTEYERLFVYYMEDGYVLERLSYKMRPGMRPGPLCAKPAGRWKMRTRIDASDLPAVIRDMLLDIADDPTTPWRIKTPRELYQQFLVF